MEKEICVLKNFRNILDATTDTDCTDLDNAIKTIEYAMKPKTCEGCKWEQETKLITTKVGDKVDICKLCTRYENLQDHYEPKVTP